MDDQVLNWYLGVFVHLGIGLLLLVYLPISFLHRLAVRVVVRRFMKEEDLVGKVVLITGASSVIGKQLAYEYAKKGASLALVARTEEALNAVAKTMRELGAPDAIVVPADISEPEEAKRAVEETVAHFGKLNHLVANAGIASSCVFQDITNIAAFNKVMDVNFWGSVYPTYYALPHLKASHGNIIVMSSVAGRIPTARMSFYNASKSAQIRFYETLRSELGSKIRITIIIPGFIATEMTRGKGLSKDGTLGFDATARDIQIGPLPICPVESLAKIVIHSACRGEEYVTWPNWYQPIHMVKCLAPELVNWLSHTLYVSQFGGRVDGSLSKGILDATGAKKFLYPDSILSQKEDATD